MASASDPKNSDTELTPERAFELLQDKHEVSWLESRTHRQRLVPATADREFIRKIDDGIVDCEGTDSPIECTCGDSFETVEGAEDHIQAVAQVESGLFSPEDIPVRFDFEADLEVVEIEPENGESITVEGHPSMVFMTEHGVERGGAMFHVDQVTVHHLVERLPYKIDNPTFPRCRDQDVVPETTPFEFPLLSTMYRKGVSWFERETTCDHGDLSLWCTAGKTYLLAPEEVSSTDSLQGILMAGCRAK
jgi:hypothetical protein